MTVFYFQKDLSNSLKVRLLHDSVVDTSGRLIKENDWYELHLCIEQLKLCLNITIQLKRLNSEK